MTLALRPPGLARYLAGVAVTVFAVVSQYFLPQTVPALRFAYGNLPGDLAVVYGIPVLAWLGLVGTGPLRHWRDALGRATVEGLRWYGGLSLLAIGVSLLSVFLYLAFDPAALKLLERPNPALQQAVGDPWLFVGLSFVVGAFEETIFRGWIFGFWREQRSWLAPAFLSSALFAGVHLYYGSTYGVAAPLIYPNLFLLGFAFAATYRLSGGNLVVVALLHGASDATAYLSLVNPTVSTALHYGLILVGGLVALVVYLRPTPTPPPPPPGAAPSAFAPPAQPVGESMSSTQRPSGPS